MRRSPIIRAGGPLLASLLLASPGDAQGVLIRGSTTVNFLELRPFQSDSVPFGVTLPGNATHRLLANGTAVACGDTDAFCRYMRAGPVASTLPMLQDLSITAWGLGRGLSMHADLRVRGAVGSQPELWPRINDRFDALSAYLQLDRTKYTVRAGRQFAGNGLGVYNYDGASVVVRPWRRLTVEGYGGWALAQGVNEQLTTSELVALDELPPDRNAYVVGAQFRARPTNATALSGIYQREVRDNRSALYSERVALDGSWRWQGAMVEGAWTHDMATATTNELRLRVRAPTVKRTTLSAEVRRFRPFFELWTIWGAFSPVGFDEGRVQASVLTAGSRLSIDVHGARRRWQDTDAGLGFAALRQDGWRVGGAANWRLASAWHLNGSYSADVGFGAARSEGDIGLHYARGSTFIGATASTFQSIYEFRVGTNRVYGAGLDAGWQAMRDLRIVGSANLYRQQARQGLPSTDWTQRRGTLRLEWTVGGDPGMRAQGAAARKNAAKARANAELSRFATSTAIPAAAASTPERVP